MEDNEKRIYELGYLFMPSITEEHIPAKVQELKDLIAAHKGEVISEEFPKMIELAYEMIKVIANKNHRVTSAYFGWVKFEMEPAEIEALNKKLMLSNDLVRFILIKTVRENTYIGKRIITKDATKKRTTRKEDEVAGEDAPVVNPEELDKQIDALVEEDIEVV